MTEKTVIGQLTTHEDQSIVMLPLINTSILVGTSKHHVTDLQKLLHAMI